jgi:Papain-like cysteine protease AvrRpt2
MTHSFQMEIQQYSDWCWAAVCQSIACYFSGTATKQCEIANAVLGTTQSCDQPLPKGLDTAAHLETGLDRLGVLRQTKAGVALSFEEIHAEIMGNSLPVCARIGWHGQNSGHFVVVCGCPVTASGEQWVDIADPFYGSSTMPYEQFVNSYLHAGEWTDTYLLKEPAKKLTAKNVVATNVAPVATNVAPVATNVASAVMSAAAKKDQNIIWWPTLLQQKRAFAVSLQKLTQLRPIPGLEILPNPLPIYHLGVRDFVRNANPDMEGKLVSWRYYAVGDNPDDAIAGDVDLSFPPQVIRLSSGAIVRKALAAQQEDALKVSDKDQTTKYEPRLLRVPGLLAEMFWLKSLSRPQPGQDTGWMVPYHTFIGNFAARDAHPMRPFKDQLSNIAAAALDKADPPVLKKAT